MVAMVLPSDEYLALATTLLDSLTGDPNAVETALLQLQALFGPMLTSSLQLVDKREVVRVSLPSDRYVYQVSGSTGKPYTLYLDLPGPDVPEATTDSTRHEPPPRTLEAFETEVQEDDAEHSNMNQTQDDAASNRLKMSRLRSEATTLKRLYCPCPGFAYNSLAGDKTVLCKHLLAALIAWKTERAIRTEVSLAGVIDLLDLRADVENVTVPETAKKEQGDPS